MDQAVWVFDQKLSVDLEECSIKLLRNGAVSEHPFFVSIGHFLGLPP